MAAVGVWAAYARWGIPSPSASRVSGGPLAVTFSCGGVGMAVRWRFPQPSVARRRKHFVVSLSLDKLIWFGLHL